jgi:tripartite-type tricarboxylate transporter receptor subunit TctC
VSTVQELIEASQTRPLTYSTAGPGSINQFPIELLNQVSGMRSEPIHYTSGNEAITALMGGHVDIYTGSLLQMEPFITDGQVTGVMVTSPERSPSVPDVPTPAEAGVAGAEVELWWGMFVAAGTPDEIVDAINAGVREVQAMPETEDYMTQGGARVTPLSAAEFTAVVHDELVKWREIAEFAGIRLE